MTEIMERKDVEIGIESTTNLSRLGRDGLEWTELVHETFLSIIREAAPNGGIGYDEVLFEAHRRLSDSFTHLNHTRDFFDNILNGLSIDRKIDSGRSNRLYVEGEQPWRQRRLLGNAAMER